MTISGIMNQTRMKRGSEGPTRTCTPFKQLILFAVSILIEKILKSSNTKRFQFLFVRHSQDEQMAQVRQVQIDGKRGSGQAQRSD